MNWIDWLARRLAAAHALRRTLRGLAALALVLAAAWLLLAGYGLPRGAEERVRAALRRGGLAADFERLRLNLRGECVADRARIALDPSLSGAVAEAEEMVLRLDPIGRLRGAPLVCGVQVRDATLRLPVEDGEGTVLRVERVFAEARFAPEGLRLRELRTRLGGIDLSARGLVLGWGRPGAVAAPRGPLLTAARLDAIRRAAAALASLSFRGRPAGTLEFFVDPRRPDRSEAEWDIAGTDAHWRGLAIGPWRVRGRLAAGRLEVPVVEAAVPGGEGLRASATADLAARTARVRARAGLPLAAALALPFPPAARAAFGRAALEGDGALLVEADTGEQPYAGLAAHLRGSAAARQIGAFGAWIEELRFDFERDGPRVEILRMRGRVGRGGGAGPLAGRVSLDLAAHTYRGEARGSFDPHDALGFLPPGVAGHVGSGRFLGSWPDVDLVFGGSSRTGGQIWLRGRVRGTRVVYNGTRVDRLDAGVSFTNEVLRLDPVLVERPEGRLSGWVENDLARGISTFGVDSRVHPHAVARSIAPAAHLFAQQFRFEGDVAVQATGRVDWASMEATDFTADVRGRRMGIRWFLAEEAAFRCAMRGRRIELREIAGRFCDGTFAGRADFELPADAAGRTRYEAWGALTNADFAEVYGRAVGGDAARYRGRCSAQFHLAGEIGPGTGPGVRGEGHVEVREGELLRVPVLGGLSRFLSRLYPGLGFASQSDFRAPIRIENGRVHTDGGRLEGSVLSMSVRGDYAFDRRLDYVIHVQLLRQSPVAEIVRVITFPLTKLFEFELSGTFDEPAWRPRNLPKELFGIFE